MKFDGISVDDILANSKPETVEQEAQIDAEKTGLDFSSVGVDSLIADRDQQSLDATSAVTAKAPDLANRERMIAEKMETTRIDAEYNLEALEKQNESNEIGKVLSEAPTLTNHLANNPANAPILRNDLGTLRDIEKSLGKFGLEIDESGDIDLLAEAETGWQAAREDVVENATVGFASGKAIGDQGILWAKIRDQGLEITEELKKVSESYEQKINGMNDRDSFIADAAQIVGTMTSAFLNSANETAALSGGVVAAGMATGIAAPVASTVAGAMVVGGSMRAMYDIEGGLAYKEMVEKGADPEKAKLISQGVGLVNSLIEFGGVTLLGKAFGPVLRTLTTKHTAKTAAALSEASMLNLISESSKAMVKSVGAEVTTEVMQELVNVAGEGLANEFANAQFDENTLESVYDRLSEIAIKTAKGMFVLGSLGMAPTIVVGSRKVYEARKAEEFFTALSDGMSKSEAAQVAPEVMAGVVQQMAEDAKTGVVYVDAAELQQVLTDNNVSLDQLEELVPGVKEVLEQKAINKEDIVMPTGQYAAKIAGTDLGKALTPHVRLSENALSVSDAAKLRKEQTAMLKSILEGKVSEEDIDQDILQMTKVSQAEIEKLEAEYDQIKERMKGTKGEERKALQAEAKSMRERIQTVKANMRVGFVAEYEALKTKMFEQIKETGVYNEADAKTNAKYGAWLVSNLARRAGLKPERVAELAPNIVTSGEGSLSQKAFHASKKIFSAFDLNRVGSGLGYYPQGWGFYFDPNGGGAEAYYRKFVNDQTYFHRFQGLTIRQIRSRLSKEWSGDLTLGEFIKWADKVIAGNFDKVDGGDWLLQDIVDNTNYNNADEAEKLSIRKATVSDSASSVLRGREGVSIFTIMDLYKTGDVSKFLNEVTASLYTVDLPEDDELLLRERTLDSQSEIVQKAILKLAEKHGIKLRDYYLKGYEPMDFLGELSNKIGKKEASLAMLAEGVKGMRYRQGAEGILIWDENAIKILNRKGFEQENVYGQKTFDFVKARLSFAKSVIRKAVKDYLEHRKKQIVEKVTNNLEPVPYMSVTKAEREEAAKHGMDLTRIREHAIGSSNLSHVYKRHGLDREKDNTQIPVTFDDLELVPDVISSPDLVVYNTKTKKGLPGIVYVKEMEDGTYLVVEEQHNKVGQLEVVSLYKKKPGTVPDSAVKLALKPSARNPTPEAGPGVSSVSIDKNPFNRNEAARKEFYSGSGTEVQEELETFIEWLASGEAYNQSAVEDDNRGSYSSSTNSITLTPKADLSTFAHEMGHWYLETLFAIYGETNSASVRSDVEVMLKDFGLKSIDEWKALPFKEREVLHERFAFYVEQYLAKGKAPTKETRGFFKRFGAWIRGVYSRFGKGAKEELNNAYRQRFDIELPEMSEEVRRVLDRMLAAESAIKQAEQAEGIVPLFKQKPADMDDGLWEQLMQESDDAYAEATDAAFERMARDEKWYSNARSRKLKEIQQQADEVKNIVRDKVEKELDAKAESKAFNMVKLGGLKMDPELLKKEGFDSVTIDALKKGGLCKRGGMSPTAVRELVRAAKSYHTTKRMIAEFVTLSDREKLVDELVTKRCLRDYSELFNTKKRDAIISKALHNEARGRMVATELSYLANDKEGRSRIYREAARRAAEQMINGMQIGSVSVRKFIAAEARASRKAYEALQSGDRYAAVLAKRAQLVQHEAALMAIEIEQEVRRVKSLKDRIFKADKKLAKTHDIDIINVARYVMTNEGLGKGAPSSGDPSDALKYVEKLKTYDPDKYALFTNFIDKHGYKGNIDFAQYTVSYAMEVIEDAQMLYRMAREAKTLTLDGKRIDREEVVNELVERYQMVDRGEFDGGKDRVIPAKSKLAFALMSLKAKMVRVENWCYAMDGGQTGPFFNYIYRPIANAAAKFRNLNNKTQEALVNVLKPMIDEWSNVREIEAAEIGYTFATKAELIGAMLHTGNESNKAKLLLGGRGDGKPWARLVELQDGSNFVDTTQWDAFVARAMQNGIITKRDMDVIQKLWDLMESTKPVAQKAFKEMYGTYFEEVEATEVVTPWGNYRGGYVPAITDHYLVPEKTTQEEAKRITQQDFVSQMPVHQPGFSKSRVPNYTKPLALDVGLLCGHVQEVLKFAVMAPVAQEVAKVISDKRFVEPIEKHDPMIVSQMLVPWLKRSYEQTVSDGKTDMFSAKLNQLRGIAGMNIMAGHIVNALQQWTGLSIAATKVKPRYMANALALIVSGKRSPAEVMELSPFMKARLNDRAFEFQSQIERIAKTSENVKQAKGLFNKAVALDEKLDAARDWASRHGYFLQTIMQAPIDTIIWIGAYNQSIDIGMSEEDAIANADSIVRTTQSAFDPENVAGIETGGALYRCFLVFYNYFNMQLNLLGESWEGAKRTKKYGKFALDSMFIVAIPSILSAILSQMLTGFDTGDDDEWDSYDAMRLLIAEPFKNVIAMAPFVGGGVTAGGAALANADVAWAKFIWGEDPYQGRIMNAPAFDALATGGSSLLQWMKASEGEDYNARSAVRGTLDLLSIVTRLPLGALKKPLGYAAGVASGDIEPESVGEAIRGTLAGKDISK